MAKRIIILVLITLVAGMAQADETSDLAESLVRKILSISKKVGESGDYNLFVRSFDMGGVQSEFRSISTTIIPEKAYFGITYFMRTLIVDIWIFDGHECHTGHVTARVDKMPLRFYKDTEMSDRQKVSFETHDEAFMEQMKLGNKLYLEIRTWGEPIKLTASLKGFANAYNWLTE